MKKLALLTKLLTVIAAVATVVLFFFNFAEISKHYSMSGFEMAFGGEKTSELLKQSVHTWKSAWYLLAFILSALTAVFAGCNFWKKGFKYASFGAGIASALNITVLYCAFPRFFDVNPLFSFVTAGEGKTLLTSGDVTATVFFLLAFILSLVTMAVATVNMFVSDKAEVEESNGAKISIPARIVRFLKDYKRELKNIVWPSKHTVVRNVIVVIVMCVLVGAFIWIVDFGLAQLLHLILGIKQ